MSNGTQILRVDEVVWDEDVYPRSHYNWQTALTYSNNMKSGNTFPPIVVARYEGRYIGIDGRHRVEAKRLQKQEHINAEILEGLDKEHM